MRLVTVNLLGGRGSPADLERFLTEFAPDVVCGQEVGHDAARILERRFPHGRVMPDFGARGKALVAQFPISVEAIDLPFRPGLGTVLTGCSELEDVTLLSVHLANPIDPYSGVRTRRKQLTALEPSIVRSGPILLVGDLNATPSWPAYRRLRRNLEDLVEDWSVRSGQPEPLTWSKRPGGRPLLRIDHILGRGVAASHVEVSRLEGVDHLAVVADLERR